MSTQGAGAQRRDGEVFCEPATVEFEHLRGPFDATASPSSDTRNIRVIYSDFGAERPYAAIAEVRDHPELTQEENLATAELLRAAPQLRDNLTSMLDIARKLHAMELKAGDKLAAIETLRRLEQSGKVLNGLKFSVPEADADQRRMSQYSRHRAS